MSKKNKQPETQAETQQARVLGGFELDGVQYEPDDVIEAHPRIIQSMGSSVDADPGAVKHCLGLDKPVIKKHQWAEPAAADESEEDEEKPDDSGEQTESTEQTETTTS